MAITAQDVNKLRQMTGAGMMDCKKALEEANGNFDEAVVVLRKKGQKISAARADRETSEGATIFEANADQTKAVLFGLGCETDFVAKNDDFLSLGKMISAATLAAGVTTKDEALAVEIDGRPVSAYLEDLMGKIGEKIEITQFEALSAEKIVAYIHFNFKVAAMVAFNGVNGIDVTAFGNKLAIQAATMGAVALDKDALPADVIARELEVGRDQALQEGKPEAMLDKIAEGRLNKFVKENTLAEQEFMGGDGKTVTQAVKALSPDLKLVGFKRITIGG